MSKSIFYLIALLSLASGEALAKRVTFEEAVKSVHETSFDVMRAKMDVLTARNERVRIFTQMSPTGLFTFYDKTNGQELKTEDIVLQPLKERQATAKLNVSLTALVAGLLKVWSQTKNVALSEDKKQQIMTDTTFKVAEAYRFAQQAVMAVDVAKSRLEIARKQQKDAEALYAYGKISKGDKLVVDIRYNNSVLELATAQNDLQIEHTALKKVLGINDESMLELETMKELDADMVKEVPTQASAVLEAMSNRGDLLVSQQTVSSLSSSKWLTLASYLPLVDVSYNWQWTFGNLSSFARSEYESLTLNLTWRFWDGGTALSDFRAIAIQANKAAIDLREKSFDVSTDAAQRVRDLTLAKDTLRLRDVGLAQAQEAYRGFEARFALGAVSVTELLFAEGTLNQAKLDHLKATIGLDIANMRMQKALGKKRPEPL